MTNILAKLNAAIRKAKDRPDFQHARYTLTMADADGIMSRIKSLIKSRDSYRTENYKLQKHAGRLKQEVDRQAGEIRELNRRIIEQNGRIEALRQTVADYQAGRTGRKP